MHDLIPNPVFASIEGHLRRGARRAEKAWQSAQAEEDTLTGELGSSLRQSWSDLIRVNDSSWRWRMTYYKFRGRGPGAEEKAIGADGIFEITVENLNDGQLLTKGLVFQAKKHINRKAAQLDQQIRRMEDLAQNANAVVEFGPEGFFGWSGCSVLDRRPRRTRDDGRERLGDFLAGRFLPCGVGLRGLYFDAKRQILIVPHETRGVIAARARIDSRFRIEVEKH